MPDPQTTPNGFRKLGQNEEPSGPVWSDGRGGLYQRIGPDSVTDKPQTSREDGFYWVTRTEGSNKEVALWWRLGWHFVGDDDAADTVAAIHGERLQERPDV